MRSVFLRPVLGVGLILLGGALSYLKYAREIDRKLEAGPFADTLDILATQVVSVGDPLETFSGAESNSKGELVTLRGARGKIAAILVGKNRRSVESCELEPQLITNISGSDREKRRPVRFADIPKTLVQAVISVEDKRFFEHSGFDLRRMVKAAWVDLREGRKKQGASTLTMQLARSLWLDSNKSWSRKLTEAMIAFQLERKLSKEQIFEAYVNEIYLGRRGTFNVHGFGEAARFYFGKDLRQISVTEAATLAGIAQRPSYYNPLRYPERVVERRNEVLDLMLENAYINRTEHATAAAAPLRTAPPGPDSTEAPYFVDLVRSVAPHGVRQVHTTLDLNLQRAAEAAMRSGGEVLDRYFQKRSPDGARPQVALIALDPRTGAVKALVGGRDYTASQLNRVLAKRQPGSAFKPFVYAAALNTGVAAGRAVFTPASTILDEPTTFWFANQPYEPGNFGNTFYGEVTLRQAITRSLNVPAIKIAESIGYGAVADLARLAGMHNVQATPAVAIGSYDATPLEVAGAYTGFANEGIYSKPYFVEGDARAQETHRVLDPRVNYLVVNLLEGVVENGTAAGVRARGFYAPAAGKTGTSRDGWFAGFTSELLCVVWVGFDDHRDLGLEGGKSALPIWTDFMKRALQYGAYRNAKPFRAPAGIVSEEIDVTTGQLAADGCPEVRREVFVAGTQPTQACLMHAGTLSPANVAISAAH